MQFNTPILFLIFNRPETTLRVFAEIRKVQPKFLFVAADGPRKDREGEIEKCIEARNAVISGIDWDCEVKTLFRDVNLGCGVAVSEAISWFFGNVEQGIILEDDCLPNRTFFLFCETMLLKFRDNDSIMHVSGNNFQFSNIGSECYYLSKLPHIWGWATWKRAWEKYDFELTTFDQDKVGNYFNYAPVDCYWFQIFSSIKNEVLKHTWDYQWTFAIFKHEGLCILPQKNLVSNIGFGVDSSHTEDLNNTLASLKTYEMEIVVGESAVTYYKAADINFHQMFRWENDGPHSHSISGKTAFKILFEKVKFKIMRK